MFPIVWVNPVLSRNEVVVPSGQGEQAGEFFTLENSFIPHGPQTPEEREEPAGQSAAGAAKTRDSKRREMR